VDLEQPLFKRGDRVRLKSQPGKVGTVVDQPRQIAGEFWCRVDLGPGDCGLHAESDLDGYLEKSAGIPGMLIGGQYAGREEFSRLVTHLKLRVTLQSQIYALDASRTTFYAYQYKPLLKFLDSQNGRLLIADEVGLGKTIETGLIITELEQRRPLRRCLIVVPAHLRTKWQRELRRRFAADFEILSRGGMMDFLSRFEDESEESELKGIVSLQTVRSRSVLERFEEVSPSFDLVVFDEAGRLRNSYTRSHHAAEEIIESSAAALLLTATPVQTGDEDLLNLLKLVDPEEFQSLEVFKDRLRANKPILLALQHLRSGRLQDAAEALRAAATGPLAKRFSENPFYAELLERLGSIQNPDRRTLIELQRDLNNLNVLAHALSRTRKVDVQEAKPHRRSIVHRVIPTANELRFYRALTDATRAKFIENAGHGGATLASMQYQRQAASSMVATIDHWSEREGTELMGDSSELSDLGDDDSDTDPNAEPPPDAVDTILSPFAQLRQQLYRDDTKWHGLHEVLQSVESEEPGAKVVVFAYFKRTLRYLEQRLSEEGVLCLRVDGDVPSSPEDPDNDERQKRIDRFKSDPTIRVLLSSEVGDEGIDLQFAHYLVNYDLPWNPMRVEQRIGRLDRIGQDSKFVTVINVSMQETIEDRILQRLYERIKIFEESIGDLDVILGEEVQKLRMELFSARLTPAEETKRIDQVANAIERKRLDLEQFEQDSQRLVGTDEFFIQEIDRARSRGRFLSSPELLVYVHDFLVAHHRSCVIRETEQTQVFTLRVSDELRQFVRNAVNVKDYGLKLFLKRSAEARDGELLFTTNAEVAQARPEIEFLTFHHPLVRAVKQYYDEHEGELHPISYVRVRSDTTPPGDYVWFLYLTEISGARALRDLEVVCFPVEGGAAMSADASEELLARMLTGAEAVPVGRRKAQVAEETWHAADESIVTRLTQRFEERRRFNDALVQNRLASLREDFDRNVKRLRKSIESARANQRRETYIKGLETRLKNLEFEHLERERQIEATRQLSRKFELKGAGIVEVRNGRSKETT
jgi:superfamily II DNA or RNA helicase